jgi:hypothetical protein
MRTSLAVSVLSLFTLLISCAHKPAPAPSARAAIPGATAANGEPATEEGCSACGGEWAAHGILGAQQGTMSCLCPTADGGKRCRDGVECQGECLTDGADHEVTAAGPPALGFFVGKCSRFRTTYGCHRVIASGALQSGPVPLDQPPTEICAD